MKLTKLRRISVIFIMVMMFFTCPKTGAQTGGGKNITSADALKTYLDNQPANAPDKPIKIKMSVNDQMIGNILKVIQEAGKYVSLDLLGSPLTDLPSYKDLSNCESLIGICIGTGDSVIRIGDSANGGENRTGRRKSFLL